MKYSSACSCGCVKLELQLPQAIASYNPRECDCSFCKKRSLMYLSDKSGKLVIRTGLQLCQSKQGSKQANFISCSNCGDVVAVTYSSLKGLKGAVVANLFEEKYKMGKPISVSPKLLTPEEKLIRWISLWLTVEIHENQVSV